MRSHFSILSAIRVILGFVVLSYGAGIGAEEVLPPVRTLDDMNKDFRSQARRLIQRCEDLSFENHQLLNDEQVLRAQVDDLSRKLEDLRIAPQALEVLTQETSATMTSLKKDQKSLEAALKTLKEKEEKLAKESALWDKKIVDLEGQSSDLRDQQEALSQERTDQEKRALREQESQQQELQQLQEDIFQKQEQNKELRSEISDLEERWRKEHGGLLTARGELGDLATDLEEALEAKTVAEADLKEAQDMNLKRRQALAGLEVSTSRDQERIGQEIASLKEQLAAKESGARVGEEKAKADLSLAVDQEAQKNQDLKARIRAGREKFDAEVQSLSALRDEIMAQNDSLDQERSGLSQETGALAGEIKALEDQAARLKEEPRALKKDLQVLKAKEKNLTAQIRSLEAQHRSLAAKKKARQRLPAKAEAPLAGAIEKIIKEIEEERSKKLALQKQIVDINAEIARIYRDKEVLETLLKSDPDYPAARLERGRRPATPKDFTLEKQALPGAPFKVPEILRK